MSDLHRSAIAAKLAKLQRQTPADLITNDMEQENEDQIEEDEVDGLGDLPPKVKLPRASASRSNP
jgi:hypothetical protein